MTLRLGRSLAGVALLVALGGLFAAAQAQDSAAVAGTPRSDTTAAADTTAAPDTAAALGRRTIGDSLALRTSPMNAFWRSFLIPGWGQAKLGRKLTAGIFVAWEGTTIGMSLKTRHELAYLRRTNSGRAEDKRREHEDWIVLLVFNHLFAGLEAYVSAHLSDFPADLHLQAVPGGFGGAVSVPIRIP